MNIESIHSWEMSWMYDLQPFRSPALDHFFRFLNFFDSTEFFLILIPFIWYIFSPRWGLRLFFLIAINSIVNSFFKALFQQPRPMHLDHALGLLPMTSYGFPSGAAQSAVLLPYLLIRQWPCKMAWVIGIVFFGFLSFSRVYLGVHFPTDLIGGWCIGLILAVGFERLHRPLEHLMESSNRELCLIAGLSALLFFLILTPNENTFRTVFAALGGSYGLFLAHAKFQQWPRSNVLHRQILQALLTVVSLIVIYGVGIRFFAASFPAHQLVFKAATYFSVGFTAIFLIPACLKLSLPPPKPSMD